jgi:uncharacterized membrane protein (UPF0127 family)
MRLLLYSLVFCVCVLAAIVLAAPAPPMFGRGAVEIVQAGRSVVVEVEIAATPKARALGLMHRAALAPDAGMLFVFDEPHRLEFWMKDTLVPLSIAFIDAQWRINDIQDMDPPEPDGGIAIHASRYPAKYALEVNQSFFRKHGIAAGAHVVLRPGIVVGETRD